MIKKLQVICLIIFIASGANAQQEKGIIGYTNWLTNWTEFKPTKVEYGEAEQILAGKITTNTKLYKRNVYLIRGNVYVTNNAVLTIEPGTLIIGDFETKGTLIFTKGSQIIADGVETDPIVFSSNRGVKKAGDWGGLVFLGDAPINKFGNLSSLIYDFDASLTMFGGNNTESNSGIMRFVRIEFAGKKIKGSPTLNSLTLAGVGSKTIMENIMVSYSGGDSFSVIGGDLNISKLVSFYCINDDFKFSYGAQCRISNSIAVRSSYLSGNKSGSRCFDIVSYEKKEEVDFSKKQTAVIAYNITMLNDSENISLDIQQGLVKEAVYVGNDSSLEMKRSVISGFNPAVVLNENIQIDDKSLKKIRFEEMYFNLCKGNIFTENNEDNSDLENWYGNTFFNNVYSQSSNKETFIEFSNSKKPDFRLNIGKITASFK
ncbi:hypothetical protein [Flavobacterium sp.]|uniref:hypothetical protein n=1 Tax=Flavobacterium sp. TaxID=239 RepID=UPI002622BCB1|nr:hypothetical protein [Flavobacterium sp.]MDG2431068.1 hypothetical protein [Flavobacterium sp.]